MPVQLNMRPPFPILKGVFRICETALGPDDAEVAILASDLAVAYRDSANYKAARPLFARSVAVAEKAYGANNPEFAKAIDNAAGMSFMLGDFANAEKLYAHGSVDKRGALGWDDHDLATSMSNLATVYDATVL